MQNFMVLLLLIVAVVAIMFVLPKNNQTLLYHMKRRRRELKDLLKSKKIIGAKNLMKFVKKYTQIDKTCAYEGPIPMPAEFSTMSADNLQLLDKCGAVRSSLNSWAIATWAENSVVKTMESLQSTMECVNQLNLVPDTYNRFQELVTACFSSVPVVPPVVPPKNSTFVTYPNNIHNLPMGVYGSPYGIYGMNYNLGTSYQGKIGANGIAFSNGVTNGFVSDSRGWRPDDYFNYNAQGSELIDGTNTLMTAQMLQQYELPRIGFGPYMSRSEIDAEVLPKYEPSQWIVNNGPVRPWEPKYPIMTIPPTPIPLLGTSNM